MENLQPKLRFPEFKDNWKMHFISDFFKVGSSKRVKQEDWKTEGIPFYRTRELVKLSKNEKIENEIFISEEHYNDLKSKYGVPKIGDLLISGVGTLGISYVVINNNPFYIKDGNVLWFNKVKNINSLFFNYSFKTRFLLSQILNNASVTTVGTYTIDNAKKTKFFYTDIQEQTKIADFLGSVDKQLDILSQKKEKLNLYKKGVMQQLFSQQIRFKNDNGNDFPDWEEKMLGEVAICLNNLRKPLNGIQRNNMKGIYPYWGANNIVDYVNDYVVDDEIVLLAEDGGNFHEFKEKPIANYFIGKCWVNNHTHILKGTENLLTKFLFYTLQHKDITHLITGGTRTKLTKSSMLEIRIDFPTLEEQTKIANFLSAIDTQIEAVENKITKTETYKKGLLQQMFV